VRRSKRNAKKVAEKVAEKEEVAEKNAKQARRNGTTYVDGERLRAAAAVEAEHALRLRAAAAVAAESARAVAAAAAENAKKELQEAGGIVTCPHHAKSLTLEMLGKGVTGIRAKKQARNARLELLDRMAHVGAGLSQGQKNDWAWFRKAWDREMAARYGDKWPEVFAGIMLRTLDAEESNAFSKLVHAETYFLNWRTRCVIPVAPGVYRRPPGL